MIDIGTAFFISITPWAFGTSMLYLLLYDRGRWKLEHHLFVIGSAAYLGYFWVAVLMAFLQRSALMVFSDWLLAFMALSVVVCLVLGKLGRMATAQKNVQTNLTKPTQHTRRRTPWLLSTALSAWLLILIASVFWEAVLRPAVAWDTLVFWADHGHTFLEGQLNTKTLNQMPAWTHPVTIRYVGAWGGFALHGRSASGLYLPWFFMYLGLSLVCMALGKLLSGYWWLGIICAILIASSPITQAHASLGGYADFWLASGVFLALAWVAVTDHRALQATSVLATLTGLFIVSLVFLKSSGIAYSAMLLGAILFGRMCSNWHWTSTLGLIGIKGLFLLWIWNNGLDWSFGIYRIAYLPEKSLIALGQRQANIASNSWLEIGLNFWHSYGKNSSYYLSLLLGSIIGVLLPLIGIFRRDRVILTAVFLLIGQVLFFGMGQHLNEQHLFAYAKPDSDTSLSRLSQTIYPISVAVFLFSIAKFNCTYNNFKNGLK